MKCPYSNCTGKHSGKYRIAELCPAAQEKRRASWRAYDGHLHEAHVRSYAARFGAPGTEEYLTPEPAPEHSRPSFFTTATRAMKVLNPDMKLDMRSSKRALYKYLWAVRKRLAQTEAKIAEFFL